MTFSADLPEPATDELNRLLSEWAARHRLDDREATMIRANVLATTRPEPALDADWLWALLRPVTSLMESASDESATHVPYLQLA
jgi:hypothetical protein